MNRQDASKSRADIELPAWFWNGNPARLVLEAQLHSRVDRARKTSWVQTEESYYHRKPDLVTVTDLAGPGIAERFERLDALTEIAPHQVSSSVIAALEARRRRAEQTGQPVDALALMQLELLIAPVGDLGSIAKFYFNGLREIELEDDPDRKVFEFASSHLVKRSHSLIWRAKIAAIMLQMEQDPDLQSGHIGQLKGAFGDGALAFQSSAGLQDGLYLFDAYLGPMLGALSPFVWAFTSPRSFGNVVTTLGQPLAGAGGEASELLQLVTVPGSDKSTAGLTLSPTASSEAVDWWSRSLNSMFAVVTDPVVFASARGWYAPHTQVHAILSIEQLFRRTTSVQLAHRDTNARRVLLFTVLDTLERLTNRTLDKHCSLSTATKTLEAVRTAVPPKAAEVLLPMAERAVAALRELQDGFFISGRRRTPGEVVLQLEGGEKLSISVSDATQLYVKALRDATHGHGSNKKQVAFRTNALLAQHNGNIPHDLGLLSYLYLLDLLCHPERLRRVLRATSAQSAP